VAEFHYHADGSHDAIPETEIAELAFANTHLMGAAIQEEARAVRAEVILRLMDQRALDADLGWLIFGGVHEEEGSLLSVDQELRDRVLILLFRAGEDGENLLVKLLQDKARRGIDGSIAFITEEVLLDDDDDCLHGVYGELLTPDGEFDDSHFPRFRVNEEGRLEINDFLCEGHPETYIIRANKTADLMLLGEIDCEPELGDVVVPGLYYQDVDAAYALAKARAILDSVADEQPTFRYEA
jgi:hypothetical protein